jgi:hypothetical protein
VYVGPGARFALGGSRGVLFGAQRPRWVDVLEFLGDASFAGREGLDRALERRFDEAQHDDWDAVGLSMTGADVKRYRSKLLAELVPGDVLITERGVLVHLGDTWARAELVKDSASLQKTAG